jgi:hypothetical protein
MLHWAMILAVCPGLHELIHSAFISISCVLIKLTVRRFFLPAKRRVASSE